MSTEDKTYTCVCRPNCSGHCPLTVFVRDGRVVKTTFAPLPDARYNRICLRGLTHMQRIYDPDRIKYPMKRAGKRGENKWERISWEEAITTITDRFKAIQNEHGSQAVSFLTMTGNNGGLLHANMPGCGGRFQNLIGGTRIDTCEDMAIAEGVNRVTGATRSSFEGSDSSDLVNAQAIVLWGYNITESNIHNWHFIADAMEKGAKLIVIDPYFTGAAAKADMYVPCRPGSDPALILSIIQVLISERLYDEQFMLAHTVAPFLVRHDTKQFLRMSDSGTPQTGASIAENEKADDNSPVAVWDLDTNQAIAAEFARKPALDGTFSINGIQVSTAFQLLKEEAGYYPPETAASLTDVDPDTIRALARLESGKPVSNLAGFGPQAYANGVMAGHGLATLASLTGNIGIPGASVGTSWHYYPGINWSFSFPTNKFGPVVPNLKFREVVKSGNFQGKPFPIKALYINQGNPLTTMVNRNEWVNEVLPKLDLIVVADMVFTDTARYADIVLPVTHYFEVEDIAVAGGTHPFMVFSEKAIDLPHEVKPDGEIYRLLALKMGIGEYFSKSDAEYMEELLDTPYSKSMGISYASLREQGMIRYKPENHVLFGNHEFPTRSGRLEFYVERPTPRMNFGQDYDIDRERLPRFFPPLEAWNENPLRSRYPLVLNSHRPRFRVHTQWFATPWLRELDPEPIVRINPDDAGRRGIANGERVEIFNDRGHAVVKAVVTAAVRPCSLVYIHGWQKHQLVAGAFSELTGTLMDPVAVNSNFMDTLVDVRKWAGRG